MASTGGELRKTWTVIHGRIELLKGNVSGYYFQQSLNEVLATMIHKGQGYENFVPYRLTRFKDGSVGCASPCFTDEKTELIPAWEMFYKHADEHVMDVIRHTFKPEFINRIDEIVIFNPLGENEIKKIVHLQLETLRERVEKRSFHLDWGDDVESYIAKAGFDPQFGARPIRRCIQNEVENELSRSMLSGTLTEGCSIHLSMENGKVKVSV